MKNCEKIKKSLPFYAEGLLSDAEKMSVKEHLEECADCSKAMADLIKVTAMTQRLSEIEPPPWFKQRIMAMVRKEAEKKSFAQKWFYPLRIKIPVQVMATIAIAVLAVYIYRSGNEQMKAVLPQASQPVMETKQEPKSAEVSKAGKTGPAPATEEKSAVMGTAKKDQMSEVSSGGTMTKMEMPKNKLTGTSDKYQVIKGDIASEKEERKFTEMPELQEAPQRYAARQESMKDRGKEDAYLFDDAKKSKMLKSAAPRALATSVIDQIRPVISVYVSDINSAAVDAEKILTKYNARKVTKRLINVKAILQAEIKAKYLKNLLSQLRLIGRVEENNMPVERGEQDVNLVIEINN